MVLTRKKKRPTPAKSLTDQHEHRVLLKEQVQEMAERGYETIETAANKLFVHKGVVYRAVKSGKIKSQRIGMRIYVELASLQEYAQPLINKRA